MYKLFIIISHIQTHLGTKPKQNLATAIHEQNINELGDPYAILIVFYIYEKQFKPYDFIFTDIIKTGF